MMESSKLITDTTRLLEASQAGDRLATDELVNRLQHELRQIASALLSQERAGHTLQPTALINEAFIRLVDQNRAQWKNSQHFLCIASTVMRRVLVDYARSKLAKKRGSEYEQVILIDVPATGGNPVDILILADLLETLESVHGRAAGIVEMHVIGGLTLQEIADTMSVSIATVKKDWRFAKAWLLSKSAETK